MTARAIAWVKEHELGFEFADIKLEPNSLSASGVAIGTAPVAYRLDYELETVGEFITSRLTVATQGQGWSRTLDLRRARSGAWSIDSSRTGLLALPEPGGDVVAFARALDCDLGLSPLTNSMPVLRHRFLDGGGAADFVMAWVSVPDLRVLASRQRYTFVRRSQEVSVVRYESLDSDFKAELTFDRDGVCIDYPGLGRRAE